MSDKGFGNFKIAAEVRDVIKTIVVSEMDKRFPPERFGTVLNIDRESNKAGVELSGTGDEIQASTSFSLQPREAGDFVRIAGKAGSYKVVDVLNRGAYNTGIDPVIETGLGNVNGRIDDAVTEYTDLYDAVDLRVDGAVEDFLAGLATKSKYTISTSAPTTATVGNAGDVHERYQVVSVEGDGTPVVPPQNRVIGRWRCAGGTGVPPAAPYTWTPMDLDATFIPKLDIGTATFGDMSGQRIDVNSLGVAQLVVSNFDNLLGDPKFLLPLGQGWSQFSSIAVNGAEGGDGNAGVLNPNASTVWPIAQPSFQTATQNGASFRVRTRFHTNLALDASVVQIIVRFYATDATYVDYAAGVSTAASAGTWNTVTGMVTTPSDKTYVRCGFFYAILAHATQTIKIAHPSMTRAADGSLIVDGSIYTDHLGANIIGTRHMIIADVTNYIPTLEEWGPSWALSQSYFVDINGPVLVLENLVVGNSHVFMSMPNPANTDIEVNAANGTKPADEFLFSWDVYANYAGFTGSVTPYFQWLRGDRTLLSAVGGTATVQGTASYVRTETHLSTPPNAKYLRVLPYLSTGARVAIRNPQLRRKNAGSLIVDGAIDGKTITGATIRTAADGARIILLPAGDIEFYTGMAGESLPATIDPFQYSGGPGVRIQSGTATGYLNRASVTIVSGSSTSYVGITGDNIDLNGNNRVNLVTGQKFTVSNVTDAVNDVLTISHTGALSTGSSLAAVGAIYTFNTAESLGFTIASRFRMRDHATTGGTTANCFINSIGELYKITSSLRYKDVIGASDLDVDLILALDDIAYTQKNDENKVLHNGVAAEQAHELGLNQFVVYDDEERPDGFAYAEFAAVGHQVVLRKHHADISDIKEVLQSILGRLSHLEA